MNAGIELKAEYIKLPGEMILCDKCKDPIFGYRYNLQITVAGTVKEAEKNLCESCYQLTI